MPDAYYAVTGTPLINPSYTSDTKSVSAMSMSSTGELVAVGYDERTVSGFSKCGTVDIFKQKSGGRNYDFVTQITPPTLATNLYFGRAVEMSPNGLFLVIAGNDGTWSLRLHLYVRSGNSFSRTNTLSPGVSLYSHTSVCIDNSGRVYLLDFISGAYKITVYDEFGSQISTYTDATGVSHQTYGSLYNNYLAVNPEGTRLALTMSRNGLNDGTVVGLSFNGTTLAETWRYLDSRPAVSPVIRDDRVVFATYGDGIGSVYTAGLSDGAVFGPLISEADAMSIQVCFAGKDHVLVNAGGTRVCRTDTLNQATYDTELYLDKSSGANSIYQAAVSTGSGGRAHHVVASYDGSQALWMRLYSNPKIAQTTKVQRAAELVNVIGVAEDNSCTDNALAKGGTLMLTSLCSYYTPDVGWTGAAGVSVLSNGVYEPAMTITHPDAFTKGGDFGWAVAMPEDGSFYAITSDYWEVDGFVGCGAVFIYNSNGELVQTIYPPVPAQWLYFGDRVAVSPSGNTMVVMAYGAGRTDLFMYKRENGVFVYKSTYATDDYYYSMVVSDDYMALTNNAATLTSFFVITSNSISQFGGLSGIAISAKGSPLRLSQTSGSFAKVQVTAIPYPWQTPVAEALYDTPIFSKHIHAGDLVFEPTNQPYVTVSSGVKTLGAFSAPQTANVSELSNGLVVVTGWNGTHNTTLVLSTKSLFWNKFVYSTESLIQ